MPSWRGRLVNPEDASAAAARAVKVAATLERREYHTIGHADGPAQPSAPLYAFSHNAGASASPAAGEAALLDTTATIYPAIAWWDGGYGAQGPRRDVPGLGIARVFNRLGARAMWASKR